MIRAWCWLAALCCGHCLAADPAATTQAALRVAMQASATAPRAAPLARAAFLTPPARGGLRLAPDGRTLAFVEQVDGRSDVLLQDVADGRRTRVLAGGRDVAIAWSGDGRLLWIADADGLAVATAATRSARRVLKWDTRREQRLWGLDAGAPQFAIVAERSHDGGAERFGYLLVDAGGATRLLHAAPRPLRNLLLAAGGRLAYAAGYEGAAWDTVIRGYDAAGRSRELLRCTGIEECRLVGYDGARQALYVLSQHGEDHLALQRRRDADGRWETVHRDPAAIADIETAVWSRGRDDWRAIAYDRDRVHWYGRDAATTARLAALQRHLPGASLELTMAADDAVWLVRAFRGDLSVPGEYLYDPAGDRLRPVFADAPAPTPAVAMQPLSWRAGDGMLLHGYVLLPAGVAPAQAPLIAWLHGGPVARYRDAYDGRLQLLVNRGYAVFVPNFRGSAGYGLRYVQAANGDVGDGRVLADVLDGMDTLLALGIGDARRQAVMGHSFGGYASLVAVTHRPRRFAFAFAAAPPVDYGWIKQWQSEHENAALRSDGPPLSVQFPQFGFPFADPAWRERMRAQSPLANVGRLQVPVYLWAGARDDRVPLASLARYAGDAGSQGRAIGLLVDPDAGHTPDTALGRDALLYTMEAAADRHFGGGLTPPSPELQAFLRRHGQRAAATP